MNECDNCKNKKDWPCPNSCGYMGTCDGWEPKPITNADRIRAMTDEELAEFIGKVTAGGYGMCAPGHYDCSGKDSCAPCWRDWLREEEKG